MLRKTCTNSVLEVNHEAFPKLQMSDSRKNVATVGAKETCKPFLYPSDLIISPYLAEIKVYNNVASVNVRLPFFVLLGLI